MNDEQSALWARVEAALDERRDPFADDALASDLAAAPEVGRAARRLVSALARLPHNGTDSSVARPEPARRRLAMRITAAAALLVGFALAWRTAAGERTGASSAPAPPATDLRAGSIVYSSRVTVERRRPEPPRAARVVRADERVVAWTVAGARRDDS